NLPEAVRRAIKQIGQKLTARFQLQGLFGIDFMIDDTQVWVLEVNPRWTASVELIEQTYRFNAIEYHLAACLEGKLPKPPAIESFGRILGKAIVFASQPATASKKFTSDCLAQRGSLDSPELADIPNFGTSLEQGNPVCTVFASGVDRETVVNQLREKTNAVLDKLSDPTHA
ncbi:MAG: ATP-grasp domain-containing protein, partial [Lacipirellulaceae bacterium]